MATLTDIVSSLNHTTDNGRLLHEADNGVLLALVPDSLDFDDNWALAYSEDDGVSWTLMANHVDVSPHPTQYAAFDVSGEIVIVVTVHGENQNHQIMLHRGTLDATRTSVTWQDELQIAGGGGATTHEFHAPAVDFKGDYTHVAYSYLDESGNPTDTNYIRVNTTIGSALSVDDSATLSTAADKTLTHPHIVSVGNGVWILYCEDGEVVGWRLLSTNTWTPEPVTTGTISARRLVAVLGTTVGGALYITSPSTGKVLRVFEQNDPTVAPTELVSFDAPGTDTALGDAPEGIALAEHNPVTDDTDDVLIGAIGGTDRDVYWTRYHRDTDTVDAWVLVEMTDAEPFTLIARPRSRRNDDTNNFDLIYGLAGGDGEVHFFSQPVQPAPPPPILTTIEALDPEIENRLEWQFDFEVYDDTQTAWRVEIEDTDAATVVHDTTSDESTHTDEFYDLPADTLSAASNYRWRAYTQGEGQGWSDPSAWDDFTTGQPPTANITSPTTAGIDTTTLEVVWEFSDPNDSGLTQAAFHVVLTNDTRGVTASDSLKRSGDQTTFTIQGLAAGDTYTVAVRVWNTWGMPSEWDEVTFTVSDTAPAPPELRVEPTADEDALVLQAIRGSADEDDVGIFKREVGETGPGTRIARVTAMTTADADADEESARDYAVASGTTYEYRARTYGSNGNTADSAWVTGEVALRQVWLHEVADPEGTIHQFVFDGAGREHTWEATVERTFYAGRTHAVAEFGEHEDEEVEVDVQCPSGTDDRAVLEAMVRSKRLLCYRDGRGRLVFGMLRSLPVSDEPWGNTATVSLSSVAHSQEV